MERLGQQLGELAGQLLGGGVGELGAVDVGEPVRLGGRGRGDLRHAVAGADHHGAAAGVEIAAPCLVDDPRPLAAHRQREAAVQAAIEQRSFGIAVSHGRRSAIGGRRPNGGRPAAGVGERRRPSAINGAPAARANRRPSYRIP